MADKLLSALISYYEDNYEEEFTNSDQIGHVEFKYNPHYAKLYNKCKKILDSYQKQVLLIEAAEGLKNYFSSDYMNKQIDLMFSMLSDMPSEAIGKAKELIESCCKTILERRNRATDSTLNVAQLAKETLKELDLVQSNNPNSNDSEKQIKQLLGHVVAIPSAISELRNINGSGHGKSDSYIELEERHAKLAVNCSVAFVDFIWNTFKDQEKEANRDWKL